MDVNASKIHDRSTSLCDSLGPISISTHFLRMAIRRAGLVQFAAWLCALIIVANQRQDLPHSDSYEKSGDRGKNDGGRSVHRQLSVVAKPAERKARFIMGIFTTSKERRRRKLIRRALAMYKDKRICSLGSMNDSLPKVPAKHCELIYTFVVGANPDGPTQILGNFGGPLITAPMKDFNTTLEPNDMTFLNIKENMEDGKTPTWFNYASQMMNSHDFDYAIKCDSDTYLRVDAFFNVSAEYLPPGALQRYAGKTTWSFHRQHPYMEGQFYVLSQDLAELVSTLSVKYVKGIINIEDSDIGYFIMNRLPVVHMIVLRDKFGSLPWKHPLKRDEFYTTFLVKESRRLYGNRSPY